MTTRASFGDFARAARAHLDQAAADDERAARPWQAAVLAQQSRELVWSLRAATDAMARYLADINAPFEAIFDRHPRQLPPWAQAGFVAHSALTQATGLLDDVQQSYGEPIRRPASWTAGHVHAAASAMRYGRDLLNTHFWFSPEGDRAGRSEWAPVIASAPVTRAVMLEVGLWARQTAQIGASAALSARAQVREEYARRNVNAASQWLRAASAAMHNARNLVSEPAADITLLHAIPVNQVGPRRTPAEGMTIAALCRGTVNSAERIRHLAGRLAGTASWASGLTADSLRQTASCAAVIGHHCQVLLHTLADRAATLHNPATSAVLLDSAEAAGDARQAWLHAARSWETATTSSRGHLSAVAVEAADLALWTGRLTYANQAWNLSRGPSQPTRTPAELVPQAADFPQVIAAVHQASETLTQLAAAEQDQIAAAGQARRLLVTTRSLPDKFDIPRPFAIAPKYRVDQILAAYRDAYTVSARTTGAVAKTAVEIGAPSHTLAAARAATHGTSTSRLRPAQPGQTIPVSDRQHDGGSPGPVEQTLRDLGVADTGALSRAAVIDQAAEQLILDHAQPVTAAHRLPTALGIRGSTGTAQLANYVLASGNPKAAAILPSRPGHAEQEWELEP